MVTLKLPTPWAFAFTSYFHLLPIVDWVHPCCTCIYRVYKLSLMKCVQHFPNTLPGNGHKTVTSASSTAAHHSTAIWTSIMGRTTEWAALHRRQCVGEEGRELQRVLILSRWWAPLVMQRHSQRATAMKRVACATTEDAAQKADKPQPPSSVTYF